MIKKIIKKISNRFYLRKEMATTATMKSVRAKNIEKVAAAAIPDLSEIAEKAKKTVGGKGKVNEGNRCKCAKAFQQKGSAYEAFIKGDPVYLVETTLDNGKKKKTAYSICSFSHTEGTDYCARHMKQEESNRMIFDEIVSRASDGSGDVTQITSLQDKFFDAMGTRGAKKKTNDGTYFDFECADHPILQVLRHPNKQMAIWLIQCAMELNKTRKPIITTSTSSAPASTTYLISQPSKEAASLSDLMTAATPAKEKRGAAKAKAITPPPSDDEEEEDADDEAERETVKCESSDEEDEDDDDEEETTVVEITTDKGASYALNPSNMEVYDIETLEDEDGPTVVGTLMEMKKKYSKVEYEDKHYSICKEISVSGRELILCVLSDKVFDPESKEMVGKLKKGKKGGEPTIVYKA